MAEPAEKPNKERSDASAPKTKPMPWLEVLAPVAEAVNTFKRITNGSADPEDALQAMGEVATGPVMAVQALDENRDEIRESLKTPEGKIRAGSYLVAAFVTHKMTGLRGVVGEPAPSRPLITVLGSGGDVAAYKGVPGFNVFDPPMWLPKPILNSMNRTWLRNSMDAGGEHWLVTNPAVHGQRMFELNKSSAYLDLELPMIESRAYPVTHTYHLLKSE